tara:strand:+ start:1811 stop:2032 length:222 start_codon:yes stop_codon:yes gene_type:complete
MSIREQLEELTEKAEEYVAYRDALYTAYDAITDAEAECPSGMAFSHHAEMEISECIAEVEEKIQNIQGMLGSL